MEILGATTGAILLILAVFLCIRPHIPAVIPAYGGLWALHGSGLLQFPSVMLAYWGIMAAIVVVISSLLPQPLVKASQGMTHITASALAGMLIGLTAGYTLMIVGAFAGALTGTLFFARTPKGSALDFPSARFIQYFCAKGLPAVITVSLVGIAIEVAAIQLFPKL